MTKKKKKHVQNQAITPMLEQLDKQILKIHYKLTEMNAKLSQLEKQCNRIEQWINQIYKHLDRIDRRTKFLTNKYNETTIDKIRRILRSLGAKI